MGEGGRTRPQSPPYGGRIFLILKSDFFMIKSSNGFLSHEGGWLVEVSHLSQKSVFFIEGFPSFHKNLRGACFLHMRIEQKDSNFRNLEVGLKNLPDVNLFLRNKIFRN